MYKIMFRALVYVIYTILDILTCLDYVCLLQYKLSKKFRGLKIKSLMLFWRWYKWGFGKYHFLSQFCIRTTIYSIFLQAIVHFFNMIYKKDLLLLKKNSGLYKVTIKLKKQTNSVAKHDKDSALIWQTEIPSIVKKLNKIYLPRTLYYTYAVNVTKIVILKP